MSRSRSRDNWTKNSSHFCKTQEAKDFVDSLKENKELQERIKKVRVL